jgi:MscS family membrane protein
MSRTRQADKRTCNSSERGCALCVTDGSHEWFRSTRFVGLALLFCLVWLSGIAAAQELDTLKAVDTSSPRDTLRSFIDAVNEFHALIHKDEYFDRGDPEHMALAARVLDCLDDSELPEFARRERAGEVAVCLKEILDRVQLPSWEEIPDKEEIIAAGGLEALTDYRLPDTRITISRVEQGPRRHEYLFSPGTVDRAVEYYHTIASSPYRTDGPEVSEDLYRWYLSSPGHPALAAIVKQLPDNMRLGRTWGVANWKWPGLIVALSWHAPIERSSASRVAREKWAFSGTG